MPRPKTKIELLEFSQSNFKKLHELVDSYSKEEQMEEFPKGPMNRNIRDVLAHLYCWHMMLFDWYKVGMAGKKPDMPAKGYTWKTTSQLNKKIWEEYQNTDLKEVRSLLNNSHTKVQKIINDHSDEELFEKKRYKWTGSTSLGVYLRAATTSHYGWAFKLIKKAKKQ